MSGLGVEISEGVTQFVYMASQPKFSISSDKDAFSLLVQGGTFHMGDFLLSRGTEDGQNVLVLAAS